jgi:hypothetical protein
MVQSNIFLLFDIPKIFFVLLFMNNLLYYMRQILYCNETVINCGKKLNTDLCLSVTREYTYYVYEKYFTIFSDWIIW